MNNNSSDKVVRFRKSEIRLHWAIAVPFIVCYVSALILVLFYNPEPSRPFRYVFSWTHKVSGACLFVFPLLSTIRNRDDMKTFFYNIRHSLSWSSDDFAWLSLMAPASLIKKITLPDQGKFNAAEKLHFISLILTYPLYILTGTIMWNGNSALLPWLVHFAMAIMATPFMFSHMFMATVNPSTRMALSGMTTGFVDRHYVQSHHAKWYREAFENNVRKRGKEMGSGVRELNYAEQHTTES